MSSPERVLLSRTKALEKTKLEMKIIELIIVYWKLKKTKIMVCLDGW